MKILLNPDTGAEIQDLYKGTKIKFGVGEKWKMEDDLADFLKDKYGFLEEIYLSKKDDAKDVPLMEFAPKETAQPRLPVSDMKVVTPNKSIAESDFKGVDADGIEWVGDGLEDDGGMKVDRRTVGQGGRF